MLFYVEGQVPYQTLIFILYFFLLLISQAHTFTKLWEKDYYCDDYHHGGEPE